MNTNPQNITSPQNINITNPQNITSPQNITNQQNIPQNILNQQSIIDQQLQNSMDQGEGAAERERKKKEQALDELSVFETKSDTKPEFTFAPDKNAAGDGFSLTGDKLYDGALSIIFWPIGVVRLIRWLAKGSAEDNYKMKKAMLELTGGTEVNKTDTEIKTTAGKLKKFLNSMKELSAYQSLPDEEKREIEATLQSLESVPEDKEIKLKGQEEIDLQHKALQSVDGVATQKVTKKKLDFKEMRSAVEDAKKPSGISRFLFGEGKGQPVQPVQSPAMNVPTLKN